MDSKTIYCPCERGRSGARRWRRAVLAVGLAALALVGAVFYTVTNPSGEPQDPAALGADPRLAPPDPPLIPTTNAADVVGWPEGRTPTAPPGFTVTRFAGGLDHPRWLYRLPNGDILVAEADTARADGGSPVMRLFNWLRRNDGSAQRPSANRITLLRDTNGDGVADVRTPFLENLNQPFGMALVAGSLYVGNTDGVWRYPYRPGQTRITAAGEKILPLPAGGYNNHRVEPVSGALWTVANERDLLGDDAPPDYLTRVRDGDFYGWPYSYWGRHVDQRVQPGRPDLVAKAIRPDYALGAHVAALGLSFYDGTAFPGRYRGGAFIGEHGSWNRGYPVGYKVVYVPFRDGMPSGPPEDFLTG